MRGPFVAVRFSNGHLAEVVVLTLDFRQEGERWLVECLETGTAAYAETLAQARTELLEAVLLQLNEIEKLGFSKEFLEEHQITAVRLSLPEQSASQGASWAVPALTNG
ncbi:MAG: hypothetical protein HY684_00035 [Chloroflexi bacterium]|nr:hypothetical protein [Chloroflexota bacterium]